MTQEVMNQFGNIMLNDIEEEKANNFQIQVPSNDNLLQQQ